MFQPSVSGTLYFLNNKPAYGSASIDILVQKARQLGAWSGTSVQAFCYADWSPEFPLGSTPPTLTVTLYDPARTPPTIQTATKTITPGSNYSPIPGTLVGTITYTRVSGTTASITLP
jgi:hypothetical protein